METAKGSYGFFKEVKDLKPRVWWNDWGNSSILEKKLRWNISQFFAVNC